MKVSGGFSGKKYMFGGSFVSDSEYIVQISSAGLGLIDETYVKFDTTNNTNPLYISKYTCGSCISGTYAKSTVVGV